MDILVIGNGFDIEHGLPTQYKDFLDFMKGIKAILSRRYINGKVNFISKLSEIIEHEPDKNVVNFLNDDRFFDNSGLIKWENESIGKELNNCIRNNIWLMYFLENQDYIDKRWVDFEAEISKVIQSFEYAKEISIFFKKNDEKLYPNTVRAFEKYDNDKNGIVEKILSYGNFRTKENKEYTYYILIEDMFRNVVERLNDDLIELTRCLEIYLHEYVDNIDITNIKSKYFEGKNYYGLLSFNYTNTFEKKYNTQCKKFNYIHGIADIKEHTNKEENNMVLGIDEYLEKEDKNKKLDFVKFKKYFQRIFKKTGNEYKKWIEEIKIAPYGSNIVIFGHSLDVSDKDILKQLILESENQKGSVTQVVIYYHNEEAYAQQIINLVKIIGQDELIDRVYGEHPRIVFKKQD